MTIRETIEKLAREAADIIGWDPAKSAQHIERAIIAILTDPAVGYVQLLKHHTICDWGCEGCTKKNCDCPCHTAESKLAELNELEKGI